MPTRHFFLHSLFFPCRMTQLSSCAIGNVDLRDWVPCKRRCQGCAFVLQAHRSACFSAYSIFFCMFHFALLFCQGIAGVRMLEEEWRKNRRAGALDCPLLPSCLLFCKVNPDYLCTSLAIPSLTAMPARMMVLMSSPSASCCPWTLFCLRCPLPSS
jgi:hypothetical protein